MVTSGSSWGWYLLSFLLCIAEVFLSLCMSSNFGLCPGHSEYYIYETPVKNTLKNINFCLFVFNQEINPVRLKPQIPTCPLSCSVSLVLKAFEVLFGSTSSVHSPGAGLFTVYSVVQFSKPLAYYFGLLPCICSSGVGPGLQVQLIGS